MPIERMMKLWRRVVRGVRRRLFPRKAYRKVPLRIRPPLAASDAAPQGLSWQSCLRTIEVDDAAPLAGRLFRRRFGTAIPVTPRHFVLLYCPGGAPASEGRAVAYVHQLALGEIYLTGGLCVDERAYRTFPKWLFAQVREQGGLATMMTVGSVALLGHGAAVFGHVGELRSRQASLRAGFADTDDDHLMVYWREPVGEEEKKRLVALAAAYGPF